MLLCVAFEYVERLWLKELCARRRRHTLKVVFYRVVAGRFGQLLLNMQRQSVCRGLKFHASLTSA